MNTGWLCTGIFTPVILFCAPRLSGGPGQTSAQVIRVEVRRTLDSLMAKEDTDGDRKITVDDPRVPGTARGAKRFWILSLDSARYEVAGTYFLSNLLQELKLAGESGRDTALLRADRIFEPPVDRLSRLIRERYWDGLTRSIDEKGLRQILRDEKTATAGGERYLYVPASDRTAIRYYAGIIAAHPEWMTRVVQAPLHPGRSFLDSLEGRQGLLSLGVRTANGKTTGIPFVVPGGRFNEMYGWDSYFIVCGLLQDRRVERAKDIVDNFVYEIHHYGAVLNANRTYYLTRSQPPFLTSMALAVFRHLPQDSSSVAWLRSALEAAIQEYTLVWMNKDRLTWTGLSRYFDRGTGPPPEVEPGAFDSVYAPYARKEGLSLEEFERRYASGRLHVPALDEYFVNDRSMRESGHDTSYRLLGRSAHLVTVDLNALLYKIERDIAWAIDSVFGGSLRLSSGRTERSASWFARAEKRKKLIDQYLWDLRSGMYSDYDILERKQTGYVSPTTLYPLWAGCASKEQAGMVVLHALPRLETPGGLAGSSEESRGAITPEHPLRQWDFPYGWAPHQMLAWAGLERYGYDTLAQSLAYRWLYTMTLNAAQYNGTVAEKYDVVQRSHEVFAEYGNVGTKFSYITTEGFGWTNASYEVGLALLGSPLRDSLNRLIPPEWTGR